MLLRGTVAAAARVTARRLGAPVRLLSQTGQPASSLAPTINEVRCRPDDAQLQNVIDRYNLKDWKIAVPAGLVLAVPLLANEVYVLSEETQLLGAFIAFCTAFYKLAGDGIAKTLDDQMAASLSQVTSLEEKQIQRFKEQIADAEQEKTIVKDVAFLDSKTNELLAKHELSQLGQLKHKARNQYLRWLDSAVAQEKASTKEFIDKFLDQTTTHVAKSFQTDAKLKKAALDQAFMLLKDPKANIPNLVVPEFERIGKKIWSDETAKTQGKASPQIITELTSELQALKSKKVLSDTDQTNAVKIFYTAFKAGIKPSQLATKQ